MKTLIYSSDNVECYRYNGMTSFQGCQCNKDCTCAEEHKSVPYDFYNVYKLRKDQINEPNRTSHDSYEDAMKRVKSIENS